MAALITIRAEEEHGCQMAIAGFRHSKDDNNGGINEIIGTVWMITLLPPQPQPQNVFPIPNSLRNTQIQGCQGGAAPAPGSFVTPALINDAAGSPDADKYA